MGREGPANILDSLFPTLSGARQTRNRSRLVLWGASRSVAVLARSDSLGASFRLIVAAFHLKGWPFSGGVLYALHESIHAISGVTAVRHSAHPPPNPPDFKTSAEGHPATNLCSLHTCVMSLDYKIFCYTCSGSKTTFFH